MAADGMGPWEQGRGARPKTPTSGAIVGLIMERYNAVAAELQRGGGHYEPLFDVDSRHNEILWEIWIDGFDTALQLRPKPGPKCGMTMGTRAVHWQASSRLCRSVVPKARFQNNKSTTLPRLLILSGTTSKRSMPGGSANKSAAPIQNGGTKLRKDRPQRPMPSGSGKKFKRCCGLN